MNSSRRNFIFFPGLLLLAGSASGSYRYSDCQGPVRVENKVATKIRVDSAVLERDQTCWRQGMSGKTYRLRFTGPHYEEQAKKSGIFNLCVTISPVAAAKLSGDFISQGCLIKYIDGNTGVVVDADSSNLEATPRRR